MDRNVMDKSIRLVYEDHQPNMGNDIKLYILENQAAPFPENNPLLFMSAARKGS